MLTKAAPNPYFRCLVLQFILFPVRLACGIVAFYGQWDFQCTKYLITIECQGVSRCVGRRHLSNETANWIHSRQHGLNHHFTIKLFKYNGAFQKSHSEELKYFFSLFSYLRLVALAGLCLLNCISNIGSKIFMLRVCNTQESALQTGRHITPWFELILSND